MIKEQIDQKYIDQAHNLEAEFFNIADKGLLNQHRELKEGKLITDFNLQHGEIWHNHETELISEGFLEPIPEPQPPCSIHLARLTGINPDKVKPATVVRTWEDKDYTYDCFVTQTIKDQWVAGNIAIGDIVLVEFLEDVADRAIVIHKVFKTW